MGEVTIGIVGLIVVLGLFLTGIELGFAMAAVGFVGFGFIRSFGAASDLIAKDLFDVFSNYSYTVVPLFVLMGAAAFESGIARKLFRASDRFLGHVPGGMAMATVAAATAFKAISGSSPATAATFAVAAVPEMDRYGYDKRLSTGIVSVVGTLGVLMPPSVFLIIFGIVTEQSIGRLFLAGIIPGFITAFLFLIIIYGWCRINPLVGPKGHRSTWKERFISLPEVIWVVVIFLLLILGLVKGFFTATEAGSVAAFIVIAVCMIKKDLGIKGFVRSVKDTISMASMAITLIAGSVIFGHFLAVTTIPMVSADWIVSLPLNRYIILILISLVYQLGGSFIDDMAFMILATPVFYPAVIKMGFDPLWFGMIIAVTVMIGVVIPPVAINVFVVKNITKVPFGVIYSGIYPFLIAIVLCGVLLFFFPQLATFLPSLLMK
jgi:tripartite ATP-independent transporter DctM subunit